MLDTAYRQDLLTQMASECMECVIREHHHPQGHCVWECSTCLQSTDACLLARYAVMRLEKNEFRIALAPVRLSLDKCIHTCLYIYTHTRTRLYHTHTHTSTLRAHVHTHTSPLSNLDNITVCPHTQLPLPSPSYNRPSGSLPGDVGMQSLLTSHDTKMQMLPLFAHTTCMSLPRHFVQPVKRKTLCMLSGQRKAA